MARFTESALEWNVVCFLGLTTNECNRAALNKNAWSGSWTLNVTESGPLAKAFSIQLGPDGVITITNQVSSLHLKCDGKSHPNGVDHWTLCYAIKLNQWRVVGRTSGQADRETLWTVDSNIRFLLIQSSERLDNDVTPKAKRFARASGSSGFVGKGIDTDPLAHAVQHLKHLVDGQTVHLAYSDLREYADVPLYGAAKLQGTKTPRVVEIAMVPQLLWKWLLLFASKAQSFGRVR